MHFNEKAFESVVCEMTALLSRPQYVKTMEARGVQPMETYNDLQIYTDHKAGT